MSRDKVMPMSRQTGYALLAGFAAIVILVSTVIFVGFGGKDVELDAAPSVPRSTASPASTGGWVGTWSASPAAAEPGAPSGYPDRSIRNVVHTAISGSSARIQLSNLYGTRPLTITRASLALAVAPSTPAALPDTMRPLTFDHRPSVTIPAGGSVSSDAVRLQVPSSADLLVTLYTAQASGPVTYHPHALQTSFLADGDRTTETSGDSFTVESTHWRYLTAVDVWSTEVEGAVVVMGDSLTDGVDSSVGANHRWTDFLAERLRTERNAPRYTVLNQGISGNQVLSDPDPSNAARGRSGLKRMHHDVLSRKDAKTVIVQLGINDILKPATPPKPGRIVDGLRQLAAQARQQGLRVLGTTLMPFGGYPKFSPLREQVRQQVNERIRAGGVFDAVIDLDVAVRDPAHPDRMRTAYDSGDHLHPGDNGYRAMAAAVDLTALRAQEQTEL